MDPMPCAACGVLTKNGYFCRPCERAALAAAEEDRANGITSRCGQCGEINGAHVEGACGNWRDDPY